MTATAGWACASCGGVILDGDSWIGLPSGPSGMQRIRRHLDCNAARGRRAAGMWRGGGSTPGGDANVRDPTPAALGPIGPGGPSALAKSAPAADPHFARRAL